MYLRQSQRKDQKGREREREREKKGRFCSFSRQKIKNQSSVVKKTILPLRKGLSCASSSHSNSLRDDDDEKKTEIIKPFTEEEEEDRREEREKGEMNKEEEDNLCTFCTFPLKVKLEEEKKKNIIRLQKCKHAFHRECFKRWHVWRQKEWEREMREMNWPKGSEEEKRARAKPTHECPLCRVEVEERFDFSKSNNISGDGRRFRRRGGGEDDERDGDE